MLSLLLLIVVYAPEDSNCHYVMDQQLAYFKPDWEMMFDSTGSGMRCSQGCLDIRNWYIDLELRHQAMLSRLLGLRYRNHYRGDYEDHVTDHFFEPFFPLGRSQYLFFSITVHYYKGEDDLGIGHVWGDDYLNRWENFIVVENFDRNFSVQSVANGYENRVYDVPRFPVKWWSDLHLSWDRGFLHAGARVGPEYRILSTDPDHNYQEEGSDNTADLRLHHEVGRCLCGYRMTALMRSRDIQDSARTSSVNITDLLAEPMLGYGLSEKWELSGYFTYNYKVEEDTARYERNTWSIMAEAWFRPGGSLSWRFGAQQQYCETTLRDGFWERRLLVGLEYRTPKIWFYLVEALEGDWPIPKTPHNHTYVQVMYRF